MSKVLKVFKVPAIIILYATTVSCGTFGSLWLISTLIHSI